MTPGFSLTGPGSVRCTGWLGRISNDLQKGRKINAEIFT